MIRVFLVWLVLGLAASLAAAHFYPLAKPALLYSKSTALANGGREEVFVINLPGDRLGSPRAAATATFPEPGFAAAGPDRVLAELFRLRDTDGQIVGLASRLNGRAPNEESAPESVTDWMLLLPSRGTMMLSRGAVAMGEEGEFVADRMGFSYANSGPLIAGTGDFANLQGFYSEDTVVESIDSSGEVTGTVTLMTRLKGTQ